MTLVGGRTCPVPGRQPRVPILPLLTRCGSLREQAVGLNIPLSGLGDPRNWVLGKARAAGASSHQNIHVIVELMREGF